jgi:hypothetical protein
VSLSNKFIYKISYFAQFGRQTLDEGTGGVEKVVGNFRGKSPGTKLISQNFLR